jgi:hypothetical protein
MTSLRVSLGSELQVGRTGRASKRLSWCLRGLVFMPLLLLAPRHRVQRGVGRGLSKQALQIREDPAAHVRLSDEPRPGAVRFVQHPLRNQESRTATLNETADCLPTAVPLSQTNANLTTAERMPRVPEDPLLGLLGTVFP